MKIRTSLVSNSSSSNFLIAVDTTQDKSNKFKQYLIDIICNLLKENQCLKFRDWDYGISFPISAAKYFSLITKEIQELDKDLELLDKYIKTQEVILESPEFLEYLENFYWVNWISNKSDIRKARELERSYGSDIKKEILNDFERKGENRQKISIQKEELRQLQIRLSKYKRQKGILIYRLVVDYMDNTKGIINELIQKKVIHVLDKYDT